MRHFFVMLFLASTALLSAPGATGSSVILQVISRSPFQLSISPSDQTIVIEASENLLQWVAVATNPPSAFPNVFTDYQSPGFSRRFYQARLAGPALGDL